MWSLLEDGTIVRRYDVLICAIISITTVWICNWTSLSFRINIFCTNHYNYNSYVHLDSILTPLLSPSRFQLVGTCCTSRPEQDMHRTHPFGYLLPKLRCSRQSIAMFGYLPRLLHLSYGLCGVKDNNQRNFRSHGIAWNGTTAHARTSHRLTIIPSSNSNHI